MIRTGAGLLAALMLAAPALAQDREPLQRQTLNELAYVMGQSHALRQVCQGASDQFWRNRMSKLLQVETSDEAFDRGLREAFNTGYAAAQAQFPVCDGRSQAEATRIARRGSSLAKTVGQN